MDKAEARTTVHAMLRIYHGGVIRKKPVRDFGRLRPFTEAACNSGALKASRSRPYQVHEAEDIGDLNYEPGAVSVARSHRQQSVEERTVSPQSYAKILGSHFPPPRPFACEPLASPWEFSSGGSRNSSHKLVGLLN